MANSTVTSSFWRGLINNRGHAFFILLEAIAKIVIALHPHFEKVLLHPIISQEFFMPFFAVPDTIKKGAGNLSLKKDIPLL